MSMRSRLPEMDENFYTGPAGTVELIWDNIDYLNDDGEVVEVVLFLDEDDNVQCVDGIVWHNEYTQDENPQEEITYYIED